MPRAEGLSSKGPGMKREVRGLRLQHLELCARFSVTSASLGMGLLLFQSVGLEWRAVGQFQPQTCDFVQLSRVCPNVPDRRE